MSTHYWHEDEFCEALSSYQCEMRDPLLSAAAEVPTPIICELSTLSERLLTSRKFRGYAKDIKDDMQMHFWEKALRALMTFDFSRGSRAYSYFTRVHYLANLDVIGAEYKYRNLIDDLTEKWMEEAGAGDAEIAKLCRYETEGVFND